MSQNTPHTTMLATLASGSLSFSLGYGVAKSCRSSERAVSVMQTSLDTAGLEAQLADLQSAIEVSKSQLEISKVKIELAEIQYGQLSKQLEATQSQTAAAFEALQRDAAGVLSELSQLSTEGFAVSPAVELASGAPVMGTAMTAVAAAADTTVTTAAAAADAAVTIVPAAADTAVAAGAAAADTAVSAAAAIAVSAAAIEAAAVEAVQAAQAAVSVAAPAAALTAVSAAAIEVAAVEVVQAAQEVVNVAAPAGAPDATPIILFGAFSLVAYMQYLELLSIPKSGFLPSAQELANYADSKGTPNDDSGRSAQQIFFHGLLNLEKEGFDKKGWFFGGPSALYSNVRGVPPSQMPRKGAKQLAKQQQQVSAEPAGVFGLVQTTQATPATSAKKGAKELAREAARAASAASGGAGGAPSAGKTAEMTGAVMPLVVPTAKKIKKGKNAKSGAAAAAAV